MNREWEKSWGKKLGLRNLLYLFGHTMREFNEILLISREDQNCLRGYSQLLIEMVILPMLTALYNNTLNKYGTEVNIS